VIGSLHPIVDPSFICSHWASHLRVNLLKRNSSQLDTGHNFEPTRMHGYKGSGPVRKILGADPELKGTAWCHIVKLEQPISGCQDGRRLVVLSFSEDDRRVRDHTPVDISDGANDGCCVTCRLSDLTQRGMERSKVTPSAAPTWTYKRFNCSLSSERTTNRRTTYANPIQGFDLRGSRLKCGDTCIQDQERCGDWM
jgi:hypothetical protein